jgi:hypothetical protein
MQSAHLTQSDMILSISPPESGKTRARKVVSRSRAIGTGKYPSWKMGRMIQWESVHERNAFRLLDADSTVTSFSEQPCEIEYRLGSETYRHFPDILVETLSGSELWEVKKGADAFREDVVARTRLMERTLPAFGYRYRLVTGDELGAEPLLSNVRTMLRWGRSELDWAEREMLMDVFAENRTRRWGEVLSGRFGPNGRAIVCRLILEGILRMDIRRPLTPETPIFSAQEP